jgi:outer membrane immunogenic protein
MHMKRLALISAAAISLAVAHTALAADLGAAPIETAPAAVAPTWSGFYLGVNGGGGWSHLGVSTTAAGPLVGVFGNPGSLGTTLSGTVFGGQLGYNWQAGNWVLGFEGDFDTAGMSGAQQSVFPGLAGGQDSIQVHEKINWLATVRGRLGYVWGPMLLYVTGGGAWSSFGSTVLLNEGFNGVSTGGSFNDQRTGWTAGAGYEWMLAPNWVGRAEYLYYRLSDNNHSYIVPSGLGAVTLNTNSLNVNVIRLGLSYKFNWPQ